MQYLENVPDTVKVATAISAPMLSVLGVSVEEWTYILSAIVSLLFIIEKLPVFLSRCRAFISWIREKKKNVYKE